MYSSTGALLLDAAGARLTIDAFFAREPGSAACKIDNAINQRGFVLVTLAHRAVVVQLCPLAVAPLAALETFHHLKGIAAECVLLALRGDTWRRSQYEFFPSVEAAAKRIKSIARSASKRAAAKLTVRSSVPFESKFPSGLPTSVPRGGDQACVV
jgi:hypothetical protein